MIKVENLSKEFAQITAVDNVNLHIKKQEILGLVGPDGAGKTTMLRMICGLLEPSQGQVYLMNESLKNSEEIKDHIGYMPQRFSLYGDLTVMENINFFGSLYKLSKKTIKERADEILELTNLHPFKKRFADNLSGGMKQKLALTCALVTRPDILILDEPTYGVDPESRKEFWKILYGLNKEGKTIMVSTPYMDEAELCSKVAFINNGKVTAVNSPSFFKNNFPFRVIELQMEKGSPSCFSAVPGILESYFYGDKYHLIIDKNEQMENVEQHLRASKLSATMLKEIRPSMEDIFVAFAEKEVNPWNM